MSILITPADTSTQSQPITFSWEAEAGATAYQLQIATDEAFTTIVHDDDTLTTTSKSVSGLSADTLHYWRVRALVSDGAFLTTASGEILLDSAGNILIPVEA